MFEMLGWDYSPRPHVAFSGWEPDFLVYGPRWVFVTAAVAVDPQSKFLNTTMQMIEESGCTWEAMIVTEQTPMISDGKYALGWARSRNAEGDWHWHPALLGKEQKKVILRHHITAAQILIEEPINEEKAGAYIKTKWAEAKAQATSIVSSLDPEQFEKEKDFQNHIVEILDPHFHVYRHVRGRHFSGNTIKRIDLIIKPRAKEQWKDKDEVTLGIEIKNPAQLCQTNKITKWLGQCIDYANSSWEYSADGGATWISAGYIHIFACPSLLESLPTFMSRVIKYPATSAASSLRAKDLDQSYKGQHNDHGLICRVMAQQGIGELLQMPWRGWSLVRNGGHVLWSQKKGVEDGRLHHLLRKFGSR